MDRLLGGLLSVLTWFVMIMLPVGWLYWLWVAIKIGGFAMFALALFPLTAPIASILGGWSLLFGLPDWTFGIFI